MDKKKYAVSYLTASILFPMGKRYFEGKKEVIDFIKDKKYDVLDIFVDGIKLSVGSFLIQFSDFINI